MKIAAWVEKQTDKGLDMRLDYGNESENVFIPIKEKDGIVDYLLKIVAQSHPKYSSATIVVIYPKK